VASCPARGHRAARARGGAEGPSVRAFVISWCGIFEGCVIISGVLGFWRLLAPLGVVGTLGSSRVGCGGLAWYSSLAAVVVGVEDVDNDLL